MTLRLLLAFLAIAAASASRAEPAGGDKNDLSEVGAKLSNPVSDVWALFTEFDPFFSDGDLNEGDSQVGGPVIFQPVLPFPLHGTGDAEWYTERTWTLVTINAAVRELVKTYLQYPPRKLQSEVYTGPITLTQYQRFQHIRELLKNEGISLPLPSGN